MINTKISSRGNFSSEELCELKTNIDNIFNILNNQSEISKQLAKEVLDYLCFIQKLNINCKTFINLISSFFVKSTHGIISSSLNKLISARDFDRTMGSYTEGSLPTFILENKKIYAHDLQYAYTDMKEINKLTSHKILSDNLYAEYLFNLFGFDSKFIALNKSVSKKHLGIVDDICDIIGDFRCNKEYNMKQIQELLDHVKSLIYSEKSMIKIPDFNMLLDICISMSDELFRFNLSIDNINSIDHIRDSIIEVIDNA